ncbi:MAG: uracil-DNA glycosylase family protein [Bryobacteraceae bacterium]
MTLHNKLERERLRQSFLPSRIRLLFIGESPPASGRFFYSGDSGLYRAMLAAFKTANANISGDNFLRMFRAYGCYLTDLSLEPIDHVDLPLRRSMRTQAENFLARQLTRFQPEIIAPLLRSIAGNVNNAVGRAHWRGPILQLPYPGRWSRYREEFIDAIVPVIRGLTSPERNRNLFE